MSIERVGVVGAGLMGAGIAEVCARAGLAVTVVEIDQGTLERARARIDRSLAKAAEAGKLDGDAREAARAALSFGTEIEALADHDLVVEAVVEDEQVKTGVFATLDRIVAGDTILASNTSSIPIMRLAAATERPHAVIGLHFFNPVPVMKLVELVPCLLTSEDTKRRVRHLAEDVLGKSAIWCQDRAGFVVNMLLVPYLLAAIRMRESGFATAEDIDAGLVHGCAHPMGPLALTDLIGLDTTLAVAQSLFEEYKEPLYAPPPLLSRMVEAGQLGRKSGRGFYEYGSG